MVSDRARNAPLLHFNYRDTRKFMPQNTKGITTNDRISIRSLASSAPRAARATEDLVDRTLKAQFDHWG
jgi:hypothetical protein